MQTSPTESSSAEQEQQSRNAALDLCNLVSSLLVADEPTAIAALEVAAQAGGADAGLFVWVIPEDAQRRFRTLAVLDHPWCSNALRRMHAVPSRWLGHVMRSSEPRLVEDCSSLDDAPDEALQHACPHRTAWLIPAPSPQESDAVGLLMLASKDRERFELTRPLLPIYRGLALALSEWFHRQARDELVARANLTERDLELLRHELLGHGSKQIATFLNAEAKTIDCRFHRLNVRLGVATRRDAVRLCLRYGLL